MDSGLSNQTHDVLSYLACGRCCMSGSRMAVATEKWGNTYERLPLRLSNLSWLGTLPTVFTVSPFGVPSHFGTRKEYSEKSAVKKQRNFVYYGFRHTRLLLLVIEQRPLSVFPGRFLILFGFPLFYIFLFAFRHIKRLVVWFQTFSHVWHLVDLAFVSSFRRFHFFFFLLNISQRLVDQETSS